jgi:hypothetical protein
MRLSHGLCRSLRLDLPNWALKWQKRRRPLGGLSKISLTVSKLFQPKTGNSLFKRSIQKSALCFLMIGCSVLGSAINNSGSRWIQLTRSGRREGSMIRCQLTMDLEDARDRKPSHSSLGKLTTRKTGTAYSSSEVELRHLSLSL